MKDQHIHSWCMDWQGLDENGSTRRGPERWSCRCGATKFLPRGGPKS